MCSASRHLAANPVIRVVFRGLKFESDPIGIGCAFHEAGTDISEKDSFRSGAIYSAVT